MENISEEKTRIKKLEEKVESLIYELNCNRATIDDLSRTNDDLHREITKDKEVIYRLTLKLLGM